MENGETERKNRSTEEATVRRRQEAGKERTVRLSSRKESGSRRKEAEAERKMQEAKAEGKHLRNSCGSESGKGERKHTAKLSTGTGKECTGNQVEEKVEDGRSESRRRALEKQVRGEARKKRERKKQKAK